MSNSAWRDRLRDPCGWLIIRFRRPPEHVFASSRQAARAAELFITTNIPPGHEAVAPALVEESAPPYEIGDCCAVCGYWFWESDGYWHSLVPIEYAIPQELRRMVFCPTHYPRGSVTEADIARGEELAAEHGW